MIPVSLPPYCPDLNQIEFIWESVKREVSIVPLHSEGDLKDSIGNSFMNQSGRLTFAKRWTEKLLNKSVIV